MIDDRIVWLVLRNHARSLLEVFDPDCPAALDQGSLFLCLPTHYSGEQRMVIVEIEDAISKAIEGSRSCPGCDFLSDVSLGHI